jgi:hypothetical protein
MGISGQWAVGSGLERGGKTVPGASKEDRWMLCVFKKLLEVVSRHQASTGSPFDTLAVLRYTIITTLFVPVHIRIALCMQGRSN